MSSWGWLAFVTFACIGCAAKTSPGWMAGQPDSASLNALTLPGTHDTMALYEPALGTAQAQTLDLADQYAAGVRYVDIRCVDVDDSFGIYHGPEYEKASFDDVIDTTLQFLDDHPTETIVMSVKQEADNNGATQSFEATFDGYVAKQPDRWYTNDSVPTLGDVRGNIVLLRRFDAVSTPLGIDGSTWADNTTFTLMNTDSTLTIEDDYVVADPATKWMQITALFDEAKTGDPATMYLTYTSGYELVGVLDNIPDVSTPIDQMLDTYFADPANAHAHLGVVAMDMVTADRVGTLAAFNAP
ncbi:MAG TPA: phosphatidylinositol-specific phospholipase C [Kofleriaceae bacterium]|jgi:1-phosphatidylinositol phosphodiesterase